MTTENVLPLDHGPSMSRVELLTWAELESHEFPERTFVIDPILKERQVAMIYAPTGVGKTWFTLSLAVTGDKDKVRQNLIIASRQHQPFGYDFPDIAREDWQDEVLRHCQSKDIKLLILDNFSTQDENSSAKIGKVNSMLLKAKQAGVTCILVHH